MQILILPRDKEQKNEATEDDVPQEVIVQI